MSKTALVLGASGRFGQNACVAFRRAAWNVRTFDRHNDTLADAANGVDLIVNGWNPPYPNWSKQVPKLHAQVIGAAKQAGTTVLLPGNVYVFGPDASVPWSASTPHQAQNPLGRIRIEMEKAYRDSGVPTILLRAGDFLDTQPSGNWFDRIMIQKLQNGVLTYPGDPTIPHAWAYLPDLCRAAVSLANRRADLPRFADISFPGYTLTGQDIVKHLSKIKGRSVTVRRMAWWPLQLARPLWKMAGSLLEMRYLWDTPHSLDATEFKTLLPDFKPTPVAEALAAAIAHLLSQQKVDPNQPVSAGG